MADHDAYEQLIQLIKMLRPMAATSPETIHSLFAQEKVAQETTKMMSTLGLLDADALANALAKMVPAKPAEPSFPPAAGVALIPPGPLNPQPVPPFAAGIPSFPPPDPRGPYGAPPPNPAGWYGGAPPQPAPPPRGPAAAAPIPGIQNLSADEANTLMAALAMSQAEVDRLPPQQRAIFMQLRSMVPGR
ncbi:hypothetical protein M408DRAFT_327236 [Serendipita vermifera MAFF 305830]|uniref:Cleavage stimulation factor subunit 2 hinge domain-containing protein n=1 Tax=Serendipita vermifera MAFF 305830 TaxID=933852 RepID=A0A0C3BI65_SERVB|nr:hypothetical protein M408DRAFT_327236 [Serendipita vermifera MAFF 305830]